MSIFEYDKELEEKKLRKAEYEAGREAGFSEGEKHGRETGFSEGEKHGHETGFSEGEKAWYRTWYFSKFYRNCKTHAQITGILTRKNCCYFRAVSR